MPITGWVAVFYPHKFYVGRVIDVPENGNPSVKFLDRRPGDVFVYRRDTEEVEKKYIFRRGLSVKLNGKKGFTVEDYGSIEKEYEEFKKKYLRRGKVRSYVVEGKIPKFNKWRKFSLILFSFRLSKRSRIFVDL